MMASFRNVTIPGNASSGVGMVDGRDIASPIPKNKPAAGCCLSKTVLKTNRSLAVLLVCIGPEIHIMYQLLRNIDYGCSLETPHRGGSNMYPQSIF